MRDFSERLKAEISDPSKGDLPERVVALIFVVVMPLVGVAVGMMIGGCG